ncbi:MAG TPA: hypothetical protein VGP55_14375 [Chitinophagaceae bacterium]|nr:hypothetical protein [Chitinophagaceae bacterium]
MNSTLITAGRALSDQLKMACPLSVITSPLPNSYFSLGFGGNGIIFSLIAGEIITDLISGNENADEDFCI